MREEREQRVRFVVGMCGRLHERAGDVQLANRQPERDVAAVCRHDRVGHAVLCTDCRVETEEEGRDEAKKDDNQRRDSLHKCHFTSLVIAEP
jgi:hypothetical protein